MPLAAHAKDHCMLDVRGAGRDRLDASGPGELFHGRAGIS
jgi:hypothetical protein